MTTTSVVFVSMLSGYLLGCGWMMLGMYLRVF